MATVATQTKLADVHTRIHNDDRVSLSEFARGKEWRLKLSTNNFLELQEHGERMAWIISEEGMRDIVDYISELETQAEKDSIDLMLQMRTDENWETGAVLKDSALAYFNQNKKQLRKAAHHD